MQSWEDYFLMSFDVEKRKDGTLHPLINNSVLCSLLISLFYNKVYELRYSRYRPYAQKLERKQ